MLDIVPVKDDGLTSCLDVQLESFGRWKKTGYELMYLDNWKFVFREEGFKGSGIWCRGKIAPRLYFDDLLDTKGLFEKYHGVGVGLMRLNVSQLRDLLDDFLLNQKLPVLVFIDTYYLPWLEKFYKKIHSMHAVMAIGKKDEGYLFNDTRPFLLEPIHGGYLDWEHIKNGFGNGINYFYEKEINVDYEDIQKELLNIDFAMFESMRTFAHFIAGTSIDKEDVEDFDGGNGILIRAIRNIVRARIHYQKALKYVNDKYSYVKAESVIDDFQDIIDKWNIIKSFVYKAYLINDYSKHNSKISDLVLECAEQEERNAERLMKLFSHKYFSEYEL